MKKLLTIFLCSYLILPIFLSTAFAQETDEENSTETAEEIENPTYLEAVINVDEAMEIQKSTIFDASQSFLPDPERNVSYEWDFGDGNKNEGIEVLHAYQEPGRYTVTLAIDDGLETSSTAIQVFAYNKLIIMITDMDEAKARIEAMTTNYAENQGVYLKVIESYGSSTEFISEEVLSKKLTEQSSVLQKSHQILIWTKENAGINALSRYLQNNKINLSQKSITFIATSIDASTTRIQRQFNLINPKNIIVVQEGALSYLIDSENDETYIEKLKELKVPFEIITSKSGKLRPWNFMSYFVNLLINNGIPDNTIALLLLLPVIATVVAFMKQVVGMTTFGIYTPSIITLSFLIIGVHVGLLTLIAAIAIGAITRPILKQIRMLYIPKMAIVITAVSLVLFLILIASNYLGLFDAAFLSIAIFPMLILSTLVEKFVSVKSEKGLSSAIVLMTQTVVVSIVAYIIVGGELDLGFTSLRLDFIRRVMLTYPEIIFLLLIVDVILGKWSGLRILERIRFREVLRHIEE